MSETPLNDDPNKNIQLTSDALDDALALQHADNDYRFDRIIQLGATGASRRFIEEENDKQRPAPASRRETIIAGTVLAASVAGFGAAGAVAVQGPNISDETVCHVVLPGETLSDIVAKIPGSNTADRRDIIDSIAGDPANFNVFNDEDGHQINVGDTLKIPTSINGVTNETAEE